MASTSEVPAWLKGSNNNTNDTNTPDVPSTTTTKDAEMGNMTAVDIDTPTAATTSKEDNIPSTEQTSNCNKIMKCMMLSISALFSH